jgi:pimeloyl-ACP methyl ester carboxylesterase
LSLALACATLAAQPVEPAAKPSFAVEVTGKGKPIILIPGLSSSGAVWDGTVAHLKDHYQCHVLTLAGFAGQPSIPAPFLETVRNDLASYIRAHKLDHPVIIGHSLGGFLALWIGSHDPDLVGPLVIVDALPYLPAVYNPKATAENMKGMAEQMRAGMAKGGPAFEKQSETALKSMITSPENVALAMTWAKKTDPAAAGEGMYDMFTNDLRDDVSKIRVPVLVLGTWIAYRDNDQDTATRTQVEQNFQTQYKLLPNAKIVLADKSRHFIMLDDPQWLYTQLDQFLTNPPPVTEPRP